MRTVLTYTTCALVLAAGAAAAQEKFPSRPLRIVVGFGAGSATDILSREVAVKMADRWNQGVVVDNRPGAGAVIASEMLARASADGHTLAMVSLGHAFNPSYLAKLPYDTLKDFAGVSTVADIPNVLVVAPALKIKTMRELIELIKTKPGQMNFSSAGIGSAAHINGELFNQAAAVKVQHVPFKSMPEALTNTIGGNIQFVFASVSAAVALVKSEKLIALAVSTKTRVAALPEVVPMAEAGLPGFDFTAWYGLLAPAKTTAAVKNALAAEIARIVTLPDTKERLLALGATPRPSTPQQFDLIVRNDVARFAALVKATGIKAE
ncbi:MAG: tripartite tricarboxylate transporter substrate binding protein [Betaproteobacteria bacterium]